jgi:hypothetical protein
LASITLALVDPGRWPVVCGIGLMPPIMPCAAIQEGDQGAADNIPDIP